MTAPQALINQIQANCHVSDASFAQNQTLCIYLLRMREFFRWEAGIPLTGNIPESRLSAWVQEREALWVRVENDDLSKLEIDGISIPAMDAKLVNQHLIKQGLVYGSGYGRFGQPHFFLAKLKDRYREGGLEVLIAGRELARDISSPVAALQDDLILIRTDSLRQMIWDRIQEWEVHRNPNHPIPRFLRFYDHTEEMEDKLNEILGAELPTLVQHEIGEAKVRSRHGEQWPKAILQCAGTALEPRLRAIGDLLADCSHALPSILGDGRDSSVHFYFSGYSGFRLALAPALRAAYELEKYSNHWKALSKASRNCHAHWQDWLDQHLGQLTQMSAGELTAMIDDHLFD